MMSNDSARLVFETKSRVVFPRALESVCEMGAGHDDSLLNFLEVTPGDEYAGKRKTSGELGPFFITATAVLYGGATRHSERTSFTR